MSLFQPEIFFFGVRVYCALLYIQNILHTTQIIYQILYLDKTYISIISTRSIKILKHDVQLILKFVRSCTMNDIYYYVET